MDNVIRSIAVPTKMSQEPCDTVTIGICSIFSAACVPTYRHKSLYMDQNSPRMMSVRSPGADLAESTTTC